MKIFRYNSLVNEAFILTDGNGQAGKLLINRPWQRAHFQSVHEAKIGEKADQNGYFAEIDDGTQIYLRTRNSYSESKGRRVFVRIVAETAKGKSARARLELEPDPPLSSMHQARFVQTLSEPPKEVRGIQPATHFSFLQNVIDEATSNVLAISNGGHLHWEETAALTALDIDRAGRVDKGRAAQRALALNTDAARLLARHIALRNASGLFVLDCTAPIPNTFRPAPREAFLQEFARWDSRQVDCLAVSRLGLMEVSVQARFAPLSDWWFGDWGKLLKALWEVEAALDGEKTKLFTQILPADFSQKHREFAEKAQKSLASQYGARLNLKFAGYGFVLTRKN